MPDNILEYNIATNIAKIIEEYADDFDYVQLEFVNKRKQPKKQNTFFIDKNGKNINGRKQ